MANKSNGKLYFPILFFCLILNLLFTIFKKQFVAWGFDYIVMLTGNSILFFATFLSLLLYSRAMTHQTTMGFLRNTYSGMLVKLSVCIIALLVYAMVARSNVNKPGIFACIGLYIVYSIIEMRSLMRWNKERRNA